MSKTHLGTHQRHYMAAIIGGVTGAFLAIALGVPLGAILVLALAATAYVFRWRILIVRKPPEQNSSTGR